MVKNNHFRGVAILVVFASLFSILALASGTEGTIVYDGDTTYYQHVTLPDGGIASTINQQELNVGEQRTLVLLVNFQDDTSEPATIQEIEDAVFNETNESSWNSWIKEVSYNRAWLTGDVYGWYTLNNNTGTTCNLEDLRNAAMAQAESENPEINFTNYDRIAIITTATTCNWFGTANEGSASRGTPDGFSVYSSLAINGVLDVFNYGTGMHEFGHTLGLKHSAGLECFDAMITGDCESRYSGQDMFSTMGQSDLWGHYNAPQKAKAGWFGDTQVKVAFQPGIYYISPMSKVDSGIKTVRIPTSNGFSYYVEYRKPLNFDLSVFNFILSKLSLDETIHQGAIIHTDQEEMSLQPGTANLTETGTQLIDTTPHNSTTFGESQKDFADSVLKVGQTFEDPANNVKITTLSATSSTLKICIGDPAVDCVENNDPIEETNPCKQVYQEKTKSSGLPKTGLLGNAWQLDPVCQIY